MFTRIFIPKKHRQRFDQAVSQNLIQRMCRSKSISEPQGRLRRSRSEDHPDRHRGSKRASSVPREPAEPGAGGERERERDRDRDRDRSRDRSRDRERERGARKSVISVHPGPGANQR